MKIAFVDSLPVGGGLSRFSYLLCKSLLSRDASLRIDYFVHAENLVRTPEIKELDSRLDVKLLLSTRQPSLSDRLINRLKTKPEGPAKTKDPVIAEIEKRIGTEYDLAYFPSAHMMERPDLPVPVVGTVHDFNWRYFFGRQIFDTSFVKMMDREILRWMNDGMTVCSSHHVIDEARKLYPQLKREPAVVAIAPVIFHSGMTADKADRLVKAAGIDYPYIIFPGNFYPHKNHNNLFSAFALLKERTGYDDLKLVLTGMNTDQIAYGTAEEIGIRLNAGEDKSAFDVRGLGYQSNEMVEALIRSARLLVSPSLYEAICTPGMDAWQLGTPTAISDIPPFREHERVWGIRSAFFDPMNPAEIALRMHECLQHPDRLRTDAAVSKSQMALYDWDKVATGYGQVFEAAIARKEI